MTFDSDNPAERAPPAAQPLVQSDRVARASELLAKLARRQRIFAGDADMFGDPAWSILLDLYVSRAEGRAVSVSTASLVAHVPPTTALRWVALLRERGLVTRHRDPADARRVLLSLTDKAIGLLEAYLGDG